MAEVARRCAPVNRDALANPRLRLFFGDAREHLLTTRERYDLVVSEPSNPYRAGIASLFSREFYRAVAARLEEGGLFLQWVQAYEVHPGSIRSLYATLAAELPGGRDVADPAGRPHARGLARARCGTTSPASPPRIREEPFRTALRDAWRTDRLEGVFARFVAGPGLRGAAAGALASPEHRRPERPRVRLRAQPRGGRPPRRGGRAEGRGARRAPTTPRSSAGRSTSRRLQDERLTVVLERRRGPAPAEGRAARSLARRADAHALWTRRSRPAALQAWRGAGRGAGGAERARPRRRGDGRRGRGERPRLRRGPPRLPARGSRRLPRPSAPAPGALRGARSRRSSPPSRRTGATPGRRPLVMQGALDAALEVAGQKPELAPARARRAAARVRPGDAERGAARGGVPGRLR